MSIGSIVLQFRQKYGHGLEVARYRDKVRPKILGAKPVQDIGADDSCEIHVLTSHSDMLNLVWTLYSFYHYSNKRYGLCVHDDGSLTSEDTGHLKRHFPGARIIRQAQAESEVFPWLNDYPRCQIIRKLKFISAKEFDFVYYQKAERSLLFDSDLLFFAAPKRLLDHVEDSDFKKNVFNRDLQSAFSLSIEELKEIYGIDVLDRYNSGLGLTHAGSIRRDWVEEFLSNTAVLNHGWRFEQTLHALCSCRFGAELLPSEYDVFLEGEIGDRAVRHYVGEIRHLMYGQGMKHLQENGFLTAIGVD